MSSIWGNLTRIVTVTWGLCNKVELFRASVCWRFVVMTLTWTDFFWKCFTLDKSALMRSKKYNIIFLSEDLHQYFSSPSEITERSGTNTEPASPFKCPTEKKTLLFIKEINNFTENKIKSTHSGLCGQSIRSRWSMSYVISMPTWKIVSNNAQNIRTVIFSLHVLY